ncbi:hypothetical protein [Priestia megaterium]|uniref:hypothetical protein n=1 Tax=Priestia megaterium TaxID=1404 RepID=UPI001FB1DA9B|nr:hypothetical protein [Priestia megaterium]
MKKILAFISTIAIVGMLASCGNDEVTTEPKPKTCEQIEPCKTALQYATYAEQGADDKLYKMEDQTGEHKSYDSLEKAKRYVAEDFQQYKNQKIKKYGVLEYTLTKNQSYLYKFKYRTFRKNENGIKELTTLTVHVYKKNEKYYPIEVFDYPDLKKIQGDRKLGSPQIYYSLTVVDKEKEKFKPKNIEGE